MNQSSESIKQTENMVTTDKNMMKSTLEL